MLHLLLQLSQPLTIPLLCWAVSGPAVIEHWPSATKCLLI